MRLAKNLKSPEHQEQEAEKLPQACGASPLIMLRSLTDVNKLLVKTSMRLLSHQDSWVYRIVNVSNDSM